MIENRGVLVLGHVVIAQPHFGTAHELGVAEDDPGFFVTGYKSIPENAKSRGNSFRIASDPGLSRIATGNQAKNRSDTDSQQNGQQRRGDYPVAPGPGNRCTFYD